MTISELVYKLFILFLCSYNELRYWELYNCLSLLYTDICLILKFNLKVSNKCILSASCRMYLIIYNGNYNNFHTFLFINMKHNNLRSRHVHFSLNCL